MAYPTSPPVQLSGRDAGMLAGPTSAPPGAVTINPGTDLYAATQANPAGTTFYLTSGMHTLSSTQFGQVIPRPGNTYVGAPQAVLDGQGINLYAFTGTAQDVTLRHLTIQNFICYRDQGVVNHDSGDGWLIEYCKVWRNKGAGVFLGPDNTMRYCLLTLNGQYGFQGYKQAVDSCVNLTVDHNEVSYNNTDGWEEQVPGCGCTGGCKFWNVVGATVTNNWVHHNFSMGFWADTNNVGLHFDGNFVNDNDSAGLMYEVSYNFLIENNTFIRNAIVQGLAFSGRGDNSFPVAAIYISESGGDPRVNGGVWAPSHIQNNYLEDNWNDITLWENADRFYNSPAETSSTLYVPKGGGASLAVCQNPALGGSIDVEPGYSDCRRRTRDVKIHDNDLILHAAHLPQITSGTPAVGHCALFSQTGSSPSWSPYKGDVVKNAITFDQGNVWSNNRYAGDRKFLAFDTGTPLTFAQWQAPPYNQDAGSTYSA